MQNARLNESQAGIKIARRNINNLRYADDTTLIAERERGTKDPLDEGEIGEWKSWLKSQHSKSKDHGIWSHPFMANRWGNSGNSVRLYVFGSKITADGDCSHEIKRHLLLGRKVMTNLDSVLKSRDITLPTKVHLVKAMVFPVVMYGCENWTVNKAECQRIDAFELWCWRRLLRVPWTARRSNHSILKEIDQSWVFIGRTDVEAETLILWPPHAKSWLIGKDPDAERDWRQEEKGKTEDEMAGWHHWLDGRLSELREMVMDREAWRAAIHGVVKSWTWPSNRTELKLGLCIPLTVPFQNCFGYLRSFAFSYKF